MAQGDITHWPTAKHLIWFSSPIHKTLTGIKFAHLKGWKCHFCLKNWKVNKSYKEINTNKKIILESSFPCVVQSWFIAYLCAIDLHCSLTHKWVESLYWVTCSPFPHYNKHGHCILFILFCLNPTYTACKRRPANQICGWKQSNFSSSPKSTVASSSKLFIFLQNENQNENKDLGSVPVGTNGKGAENQKQNKADINYRERGRK